MTPEVIDGGVDENAPDPCFEGIFQGYMMGFKMNELTKNFEEPVVYNFQGLFFIRNKAVTYREGITVKMFVKTFLALPFQCNTTPYYLLKGLLRFVCWIHALDFKTAFGEPGLPRVQNKVTFIEDYLPYEL